MAWLRGTIEVLSQAGALFIAYVRLDWPHAGIDNRLHDEPSRAVWREFCSGPDAPTVRSSRVDLGRRVVS